MPLLGLRVRQRSSGLLVVGDVTDPAPIDQMAVYLTASEVFDAYLPQGVLHELLEGATADRLVWATAMMLRAVHEEDADVEVAIVEQVLAGEARDRARNLLASRERRLIAPQIQLLVAAGALLSLPWTGDRPPDGPDVTGALLLGLHVADLLEGATHDDTGVLFGNVRAGLAAEVVANQLLNSVTQLRADIARHEAVWHRHLPAVAQTESLPDLAELFNNTAGVPLDVFEAVGFGLYAAKSENPPFVSRSWFSSTRITSEDVAAIESLVSATPDGLRAQLERDVAGDLSGNRWAFQAFSRWPLLRRFPTTGVARKEGQQSVPEPAEGLAPGRSRRSSSSRSACACGSSGLARAARAQAQRAVAGLTLTARSNTTVLAGYTLRRYRSPDAAGVPRKGLGISRLILHAGTHTTGSARLQQALARRRHALRASGLHYADARPFFGRDEHSHELFASALTGTDDQQFDLAHDFVHQIRDEMSDGDTVLLSTEALYRYVDGVDTWQKVSDVDERWKRRRAYLWNLADSFPGFDVEVVLLLQRPDRFVESFYAEMVRSSLLQEPFHRWRESRAWLCDYLAHIELLRTIFPKVTVLTYDEGAARLKRKLFDWLAVEEPGDVASERRSPDPRVLLWMRLARPGTWAQRREFPCSDEPVGLFDDHGWATFWGSLRERQEFLHRFRGPFGHAYFDPPTENGSPATLRDVVAGRIAARWRRWQHKALARAALGGGAGRAAPRSPAPSATGGNWPQATGSVRPRLSSVDEPNSPADKHARRFAVIGGFLQAGSTGAELGTFKGGFLDHLLSAGPRRLYAVDPWYRHTPTWRWALGDRSTVNALARLLDAFRDEIDAGVLVPRVEFSTEFLSSLPDETLDWVYIDSTHQYEQTKQELALCRRKVKASGYIIGDDYQADPQHPHHGVWKAVQEHVRAGTLRLLVDGEANQFVAALR